MGEDFYSFFITLKKLAQNIKFAILFFNYSTKSLRTATTLELASQIIHRQEDRGNHDSDAETHDNHDERFHELAEVI